MTAPAPAYNGPARFPRRRVPPRYRPAWAPAGMPLDGPGSLVDGFDIAPAYNDDPPPFTAATGLLQAQGDNAAIIAPMSMTVPAGMVTPWGDEGPINQAYQTTSVVKLLAGAVFDLQSPVLVPAGAKLYLQGAVINRALITLGAGACIVDDCTSGGGGGLAPFLAAGLAAAHPPDAALVTAPWTAAPVTAGSAYTLTAWGLASYAGTSPATRMTWGLSVNGGLTFGYAPAGIYPDAIVSAGSNFEWVYRATVWRADAAGQLTIAATVTASPGQAWQGGTPATPAASVTANDHDSTAFLPAGATLALAVNWAASGASPDPATTITCTGMLIQAQSG